MISLSKNWIRLGSLGLLFVFAPQAEALDEIIRPYQSTRSAGMGGVRMTTGLYDENFFNNPARITANPESKFTILQAMPAEFSNGVFVDAQSLAAGGNNTITSLTNSSGQNAHLRSQVILPAYYYVPSGDRKISIAVAFIASAQADVAVRQSFQASASAFMDLGPSLTVGRKFLKDDRLSIGATTHLAYRLSGAPTLNALNYVSGSPFSLTSAIGDGAMIDFDLGTTYQVGSIGQYDFSVGAAAQNLLGGGYNNLGLHLPTIQGAPIAQPRSLGLGTSVSRKTWGIFSQSVCAFEVTDIGNNANGSLFRLLHLGAETHWKSIALRAGLNQGYWAAGLGMDLHYFTLDLASYGEELGLNAGVLEDRRYAANFGIHI